MKAGRTIIKIIATLGYYAALIAAGRLYGTRAALLGFLASMCVAAAGIAMRRDIAEAEEEAEVEPVRSSCRGCKHNLGGGCCRMNLEDECEAGGGYEAWEE